MRFSKVLPGVAAIVVGIFITSVANASAYTFTTYNPPGAPSSYGTPFPNAINDAGDIAGNFGNGEGFLEVDGRFTVINEPGSIETIPFGINDNDEIVGGFALPGSGEQGFAYKNGIFTTIDYPDAITTYALGVNDAGEVIGTEQTSTSANTYSYYDGVYSITGDTLTSHEEQLFPAMRINLNYPGAIMTTAEGVDNEGTVVGRYISDAGVFGFVATPSVPVSEPSTLALLVIELLGLFGLSIAVPIRGRRRA